MDEIKLALEEVRRELQEVKSELKETRLEAKEYRHETNNRFQEMLLTREALLAKKAEIYSRNELDRIFDMIATNTQGVKDLLEKHTQDDDRRLGKIEDKIDAMKNTTIDKAVGFGINFLMWALGSGVTWLLFAMKK